MEPGGKNHEAKSVAYYMRRWCCSAYISDPVYHRKGGLTRETDAIENKLRQIEPGTRATGNQSLAERLGVPGQNPPAVQSNQTPPPQPDFASAR